MKLSCLHVPCKKALCDNILSMRRYFHVYLYDAGATLLLALAEVAETCAS